MVAHASEWLSSMLRSWVLGLPCREANASIIGLFLCNTWIGMQCEPRAGQEAVGCSTVEPRGAQDGFARQLRDDGVKEVDDANSNLEPKLEPSL